VVSEREAQLEIEIVRLESEVARLRKLIHKAYGVLALEVIRPLPRTGAGVGRPTGSTRYDERVFATDLFQAYEALPANHRSRAEVAQRLGISRRTLLRYLNRWTIMWPPSQTETLEEVLERLRAQQAPPQGPHTGSPKDDHQGGAYGSQHVNGL